MNTELFIARKVFIGKGNRKGISYKIVSIAVASISIGLAIMILSVSVLLGFKKQIREKVIGFSSHFQVVNHDTNSSFETQPVTIDSLLINDFSLIPHVTGTSQFATKPGIIKTKEAIHPLVLKGVCHSYNWNFFQENMVKGRIPEIKPSSTSREVIISEKLSKLLKLDVDSSLFCFFWNEGDSTPRNRKFIVSGIYRTSFSEFDDVFVVGDIKQVTKLNGWHNSEISGYEISIDNFELLDQVENELRAAVLNRASEQTMLKVESVTRKYSMIFDWLSVLDMNVWVLLILMIAVAGINMISGLLIIILERSRMIGILKAMGYPNFSIRKVFLYLSAFLCIRGLIWGNLLGIGICLFQWWTGIFTLDPVSYYIDSVPIYFNFFFIFLLNIGSLVAIIGMIIIPSFYISKISPVESIAFE